MSDDAKDPTDENEKRPSAVDSLVFSSQQEPKPQKVFQPTSGMGGFRRASSLTAPPAAARGMTSRATTSVRASGQARIVDPARVLPEPASRVAQPHEVVRTLPVGSATVRPAPRPVAPQPAPPLPAAEAESRTESRAENRLESRTESRPGGDDSPLRRAPLTASSTAQSSSNAAPLTASGSGQAAGIMAANRGVLPPPARKRFVQDTAGNVQTTSPVQTATETGRQIVDAARAEGDRIVREAKRYIDAEREHARFRGAEEGKREAAEMILHAHALRREILESAKVNALDLIFDIAREVVQRELASDHGSVLGRIEKGLEKLLSSKQITITVHTEDLRFVRENINDLIAEIGVSTLPQITASESVTPGSARLETESTVVEASVESHLSAIRNYLERAVSQNISEQEEQLSGKTH